MPARSLSALTSKWAAPHARPSCAFPQAEDGDSGSDGGDVDVDSDDASDDDGNVQYDSDGEPIAPNGIDYVDYQAYVRELTTGTAELAVLRHQQVQVRLGPPPPGGGGE
jgi:hypothetical protein